MDMGDSDLTDIDVDVYMPLYVADYLAATEDLNAEEHGAYLLLMINMWKRRGVLPNHPDRLRRIAKVERERWPEVWDGISRFFNAEGAELTQKRIGEELDKARKKKVAKATAGRSGGIASGKARRKQTRSEIEAAVQAEPNDRPSSVASKPEAKPNPSPSPSPSYSESEPRARDPSDTDTVPVPGPTTKHPTTHDVLHWYGLAFRETYHRFWTPDPGAPACARTLLEDQIAALPPEEAGVAYADLRRRIGVFLASKEPSVVKHCHPFRWFCERFNELAAETSPPTRNGDAGGRPYFTGLEPP